MRAPCRRDRALQAYAACHVARHVRLTSMSRSRFSSAFCLVRSHLSVDAGSAATMRAFASSETEWACAMAWPRTLFHSCGTRGCLPGLIRRRRTCLRLVRSNVRKRGSSRRPVSPAPLPRRVGTSPVLSSPLHLRRYLSSTRRIQMLAPGSASVFGHSSAITVGCFSFHPVLQVPTLPGVQTGENIVKTHNNVGISRPAPW